MDRPGFCLYPIFTAVVLNSEMPSTTLLPTERGGSSCTLGMPVAMQWEGPGEKLPVPYCHPTQCPREFWDPRGQGSQSFLKGSGQSFRPCSL